MSWRARKGWLPSCSTNALSSRRGRPSRLMRCVAEIMVLLDSALGSAARVQLGGAEEVGDLACRGVGRIGAVDHVLLDAGREIGADRAGCGLLRIGGSHDVAVPR